MSEHDHSNEARIERWLASIERHWQRNGISKRDQRRLSAELQRDTDDAIASGAALDNVLEQDHERFAADIAAAHGLTFQPTRSTVTTKQLALRATLGAMAGFAFGWFFAWPVLGLFVPNATETAFLLIAYATIAATTITGAAVVIRRAAGPRLPIRDTGLALSGLTIGALVAAPIAMGLAAATGYESSAPVVTLEAAIVGAGAWIGLTIAASRTPSFGNAERRSA